MMLGKLHVGHRAVVPRMKSIDNETRSRIADPDTLILDARKPMDRALHHEVQGTLNLPIRSRHIVSLSCSVGSESSVALSALLWYCIFISQETPISERLPELSHFLGHRPKPQRDLGHLLEIFWAIVGVFVGLTLIEVIGQQIPSFQEHNAPLIVGSFGAAAVLEFYAIGSPLSQPRNAVIGQVLASVVGVGIRKLFELGSTSRDLIWLGGSVSCALATAVMALTGTVHPPAGATALLAVVDDNVAALGWSLLPVILLGCIIMQCVALLLNNIQRRFPMYWWSPEDVGHRWKRGVGSTAGGNNNDGMEKIETCTSHEEDMIASPVATQLTIGRGGVRVPEGMLITPEELLFLETLCERL
ncbi:putative HPP family-domain-containing protein [Seiridium cardinale]|uniref:HPP family-domain-containing protein n=1 Tax=Seiridium cardinale TaxID=138064 RepID=A0ABR2XXH7_9PEZI